MYCTKCGFELIDGTKFCRKCGSQNIYNDITHNETKSNIDIKPNSKEINKKKNELKETNPKQDKHKGFIFLGVIILLISVGFGSYYFSVSKFFSDNSKKSQETSTKPKLIPKVAITKEAPIKKPSVAKPTNTNTDDIFPKSKTQNLIDSDLTNLSKEDLSLGRNEIYARYGRIFKEEPYKNYFNNKSWYTPNPNFNDGELNNFERYNIQFIKSHEK